MTDVNQTPPNNLSISSGGGRGIKKGKKRKGERKKKRRARRVVSDLKRGEGKEEGELVDRAQLVNPEGEERERGKERRKKGGRGKAPRHTLDRSYNDIFSWIIPRKRKRREKKKNALASAPSHR